MAIKTFTRREVLQLFSITAALAAMPAQIASADTQDDLNAAQKKLDEVQKQLDTIASQYEKLVGEQEKTCEQIEDAQTQIASTQDQIDKKQQELDAKKSALSKRVSSAYKSGIDGFLSVLLSSSSLAELSSNIYYLDKISEKDRTMIEEVNRVKRDLDDKKSSLESHKAALEQLKEEQDKELTQMTAKQDESKRVLDGLSQDVKDLMAKRDAELQAAAQQRALQEAQAAAARSGKRTYTLSEVSGEVNLSPNLSGSQKAVISYAYRVGSPGYGLCAMWVSQVFSAAGLGYPSGDACDMYYAWCHSSNKSELKPGMIIAVPAHAGTPAGRIYGHIGIYVGNGEVRHNIGSVATWSLDRWISYYSSITTPRWGWCMGIPLS